MPTACINQQDVRVQLVGERLEVIGRNPDTERDELLREIPLRDLDRIIVSETVHFTAPAMAAILRASIPIQFFSWSGQFLGNFLPAQNKHGLVRLRQYRKTLEPEFVLHISRKIVIAKLYNQRRVLQRLAAARAAEPEPAAPSESTPPASSAANPAPARTLPQQPDTDAALAWLDSLFPQIRAATGLDEVRGYEGIATARYFQTWAAFLPPEFPFERRSTRPPLNPVNACISFCATILYNEMVSFIHAHGLDPALGTLHTTEDGRWSLALDLIEPFRPVLVEALALDLFNHRILGQSHFEPQNNGVYLNSDGRKKFFLQYERRMERQFMSESAGHRTTLRQQLENQALLYKSALDAPDQFEPFLIN